jgi:hypothetical protein
MIVRQTKWRDNIERMATHAKGDNGLVSAERAEAFVDVGHVPAFAAACRANHEADAVIRRRALRAAQRRRRERRKRKRAACAQEEDSGRDGAEHVGWAGACESEAGVMLELGSFMRISVFTLRASRCGRLVRKRWGAGSCGEARRGRVIPAKGRSPAPAGPGGGRPQGWRQARAHPPSASRYFLTKHRQLPAAR